VKVRGKPYVLNIYQYKTVDELFKEWESALNSEEKQSTQERL
jgi:hypothetical protein